MYKDRTGEIRYNNNHELMKIVEYQSNRKIYVQFQDRYESIRKTSYGNFKKGNVENPYFRKVYNKGMLGIVANIKGDKNYQKALAVWRSMIQRCYDTKLHEVESTYEKCETCREWLLFTNFYKWFKENYYEAEGESIQLDKDILHKGNKLYSPENCCFVPHSINSLLTKSDKSRGDLPIGVTWINRDHVYRAQCNNGHKKEVALGVFHDKWSAYYAYKRYKENIIKKMADHYKNILNPLVYEALTNYEVEPTD